MILHWFLSKTVRQATAMRAALLEQKAANAQVDPAKQAVIDAINNSDAATLKKLADVWSLQLGAGRAPGNGQDHPG